MSKLLLPRALKGAFTPCVFCIFACTHAVPTCAVCALSIRSIGTLWKLRCETASVFTSRRCFEHFIPPGGIPAIAKSTAHLRLLCHTTIMSFALACDCTRDIVPCCLWNRYVPALLCDCVDYFSILALFCIALHCFAAGFCAREVTLRACRS